MGYRGKRFTLCCALSVVLGLSACGGELFGHPGAERPDATQQVLSAQARTLVQTARDGLPVPTVDIAAWPAPGFHASLPEFIADTAIEDATAGSAPHSLLRAQRGAAHPLAAIVNFPLEQWPADAQWKASYEGGDTPDVWLDASVADGDWRAALDALDTDVRVVLTHCAAGGLAATQVCLQALRRRGNTWLALGGYTHRHAVPDPLMAVLQSTDLHARYRWSSSWPAPAVNWAIWLRPLAKHGFIAKADVAPLRELYADNPLQFDLVLWRSLRLPGTQLGLPATVFSGLPQDESAAD